MNASARTGSLRILRPGRAFEGRPEDRLVAGVAQIAPVWLHRDETLRKIAATTARADDDGCGLVLFGEALAPGYPFRLERTGGACFDDPKQKAMHARYVDEDFVVERGDLEPICAVARERGIAAYVGIVERAPDRGGHSLYCSLAYIDAGGTVRSVHGKPHPTCEERLAWAQGDGHGLVVHALGPTRSCTGPSRSCTRPTAGTTYWMRRAACSVPSRRALTKRDSCGFR